MSRDAEERKVLADVARGMGREDLAALVDPNELFRFVAFVRSVSALWLAHTEGSLEAFHRFFAPPEQRISSFHVGEGSMTEDGGIEFSLDLGFGSEE